jgi:hypothetical protein
MLAVALIILIGLVNLMWLHAPPLDCRQIPSNQSDSIHAEPGTQKKQNGGLPPSSTIPSRHAKQANDEAKIGSDKAQDNPSQWGTSDKIAAIAGFIAFLQFIALVATWRLMVRTAHRQLRSYVFIRGGEIRLIDSDAALSAIIKVENFGQTPGYAFETWTKIKIGEPSDIPFDWTYGPMQRSVIAPKADFNVPSEKVAITPAIRGAINKGDKVIFVWGRASHTDAFGIRWQFDFRATNGDGEVAQSGWKGWGLKPHPLGYTETRSKTETG